MVSIREVVPTVNGFTGADKTVSATTCLAGDTLVIAHICNTNPFPSDPTSSAGTPGLAATITNGFSGRARLSVYLCPVTTSGTKTVTFTGGAAADIQGHVVVIAGGVTADGTSTNPGVDSLSAAHVMNAVSPVGAADLLLAFFGAFNTAAGASYYSAAPSAMTLQAQSYDAGFLQLATFSEALAASGSTGTRTVTPVTSDNRYVSVGIALKPSGLVQALPTVIETNTAMPLGRVKSRALVAAVETNAAITLGRTKRRLLAVAIETDVAVALGGAPARPPGLVLAAAGTTATLTAAQAAAATLTAGAPASALTASGTP